MRTLFLAFLLLPLVAFADEARVAVGMSRDEAVALVKKNGGEDVTSGQQILGPKGDPPPLGIYWAFRDYDAIISLAVKDGKVVALSFWRKKDFDVSKVHRAKTAQRITALKLDTKTKEVWIENKKNAT